MKIGTEDLQDIAAEPLQLFYDGIKAAETKEKYTRTLRRILCDILEDLLRGSFEERAAELVSKSRSNPDFALSVLLALSRQLRKRTELEPTDPNYLNPISIENYFGPIKKLFDMNGVPVVWKRVYATYPEVGSKSSGRAYSRQEIAKALNFVKGAIDRAIILVAASSGIREGGFKLRWEELRAVYRLDGKLVFDVTESEVRRAEIVCGILTVYAGTEEEYPAFITPEAYQAIEDYRLTWTRDVGREPKPHEPIFKQEGDLPIMLKPTAVLRRVERVLQSAGMRPPLPKGKKRHEVPTMNGFRRFFNKTNKETISQDSPLSALIKKEYMMAHTGLVKLDRNYYQVHIMELVEEYLNAVPYLTIDDSERLRLENKSKQTKIDELESTNKKLQDSLRKVDELWADKQRMENSKNL